MDKVYIVTSGEYSDYGIDEVFDNREDAEKYVCLHKRNSLDDLRVEEYDICKNAELDNVKVYYGITFILRDSDNENNYFEIVYDNKPIKTNIEEDDCFGQKEYYGTLPLSNRNVFNNKDIVEKIVYDAVSKFKAEKAGV